MPNPSKRFQAQSSTRDLLLNSASRATARSAAAANSSSYVLYPTGSHFAGRSVRIFCKNAVFLHEYKPVSLPRYGSRTMVIAARRVSSKKETSGELASMPFQSLRPSINFLQRSSLGWAVFEAADN